MADVTQQQRRLDLGNGPEIVATTFEPADGSRATVVINSAMATPRQYYRHFARWLGRRGLAVVTYDYRGIGDSAPPTLAACQVRVSDWAGHEMRLVLQWARRHFGESKLFVVGHSIGGQLMGLVGGRVELDAMVTLSAQTGYWRRQYPGHRLRVFLVMKWLFPWLTALFGYFPWSRLFGGEDLPKPAALQWARWCLDPHYLLGDPSVDGRANFGRFSAPIIAYSFDDDHWGYQGAVDWMMDQYTGAPVERIHVSPADIGVDHIGHVGFFRPNMQPLWKDLVDRLDQF